MEAEAAAERDKDGEERASAWDEVQGEVEVGHY